MHEAVQILAGVPEAHTPAGAGLIIGCGAAHIECDHALVLVPDVHHAAELFVVGLQAVIAQQFVPVGSQLREGSIHGGGVGEFTADPVGGILTDDAGGKELLISGILAVAQGEDGPMAFAGGQGDLQMVAADGIPAGDSGEGAPLLPDQLGIAPVAHVAQEGVAVRVPAGGGDVDPVEGIVVPALPVFGFMINHAVLHFGFGDVEVSLIVLAVVHRVPQAPFHGTPDVDGLFTVGLVGQD